MTAIWNFTKKHRGNQNKHQPIRRPEGELTQNGREELTQWAEWVKEGYRVADTLSKHEIMHITEEIWTHLEEQYATPQQTQIHGYMTTPELGRIRKGT